MKYFETSAKTGENVKSVGSDKCDITSEVPSMFESKSLFHHQKMTLRSPFFLGK